MIYVNARFLTQNITGVQRYAIEMSLCLKKILPNIEFLTHSKILHKELAERLHAKVIGKHVGHLWEQWDLPRYLKKQGSPLLINFANTAPLFYDNQIVTIHDLAFIQNPKWFSLSFIMFYKFLIPRITRRALKVITVSQFSRNELINRLNIDPQKIEVIPGGLFSSLQEVLGKEVEVPYKKYILAVSSIDPRKNFHNLILAFRLLQDKDISLVIVGSRSSIFGRDLLLERLIADTPNVYFTGWVSNRQLVSYYKNAEMLVSPSFYEGFGLPPLEAIACGCPVVVSDIPPHHEVVGEAGIYVNPSSPQSIAHAMNKILTDDRIRQEKIKMGKQRSRQFDFLSSAGKLKKLIEEVNRFHSISIDIRMFNMSGVGRYIRSIIFSLLNMQELKFNILGFKQDLEQFNGRHNVKLIPVNSNIYRPWEHVEFRRKVPKSDIFFSPHFLSSVFNLPVKKRVITIHDVFHISRYSNFGFLQKIYMRLLYNSSVKKAHKIITVSQTSKSEIEKYLPLARGKITVINNFIDSDCFYQMKQDDLKEMREVLKKLIGFDFLNKFALYVGNIKPHKNLIRLLEAFSEVNDKSLYLIITGDKEGFITRDVRFEKWLKRVPNVFFTGRVEDSHLRALYNLAEFYIIPSYYEGFGYPPLEAMACGTPVVASDIPVIREVCGNAALYFDPFSVEDIRSKIQEIHSSQKLRKELIEKGKQRLKLYSKEITIKKHLEVLFQE